jgi:glutamate-1-semialdehyde 2,1-aminomutase
MASLRSGKLFARAQKVIPGGVNSPVRAFKSVGGVPRFMASGSGPYITDVDGRRYVDYCGSWGPLILGHGRREVVQAAIAALKNGSTFGAATQAEVQLAEKIRGAFPSMQLLRLTSSGTEAVMSALRVARAFTGRELIVKFSGCYHGHCDSLLVKAGSGAAALGYPDSAGVPKAWAKTTLNLPYNDLESVRRAFQKHKGRIAAVIVEPVAGNMGVVYPKNGFLEGLRALTRKDKSLLIFDEVITGFRLCYGGAQTLWGIKPDLTCLGKIVGGGLPLAAYGGRKDIMSLIAPLGPVYQAGTLSGNPVAVAAGLATLKILDEQRPYARMAHLTEYLMGHISAEAAKARLPLQIHSGASLFTLFFAGHDIFDNRTAMGADKALYGKFFHRLLEQGVYFPPAQWEAAFLSYAHQKKELDLTVRAVSRAFRGL